MKKRFYGHIKSRWGIVAAFAVFLCAVLVSIMRIPVTSPAFSKGVWTPRIVIDPGHGGEDSGARAPDGTREKHINLAIGLAAADMMRLFGYEVVMTRVEDISIHDSAASTMREKKVSDMKNRLTLYDSSTVTVAIHQNKFGQSQYHGAQLFCATQNPASREMGKVMRETLYSLIQPDNTRELKMGDENIYLLYKTTAPAVMVECGFLSNPGELEDLKNKDYQRKLAYGITCGILAYAPS